MNLSSRVSVEWEEKPGGASTEGPAAPHCGARSCFHGGCRGDSGSFRAGDRRVRSPRNSVTVKWKDSFKYQLTGQKENKSKFLEPVKLEESLLRRLVLLKKHSSKQKAQVLYWEMKEFSVLCPRRRWMPTQENERVWARICLATLMPWKCCRLIGNGVINMDRCSDHSNKQQDIFTAFYWVDPIIFKSLTSISSLSKCHNIYYSGKCFIITSLPVLKGFYECFAWGTMSITAWNLLGSHGQTL